MKNFLLDACLVLLLFLIGSTIINHKPAPNTLEQTIESFEKEISNGQSIKNGYTDQVVVPKENLASKTGKTVSEFFVSGISFCLEAVSEMVNNAN